MNNWVVITYTMLCLITSACHKAEATSEEVKPEEKPEHHCVIALSKPVWHFGTLCPEGMLSQGHGVNPKGQMVSGCVKLEMKCSE